MGSDSNVRISVADELRTLEYGQRLFHRKRNVLSEPERSTGRRLFEAALDGQALAVGRRADFVVLHDAGFEDDSILDHWLFSADNAAIKSVYRAGKPIVLYGRHVKRDTIVARYAKLSELR